jgi:UDP-glucuronate decarboxylase
MQGLEIIKKDIQEIILSVGDSFLKLADKTILITGANGMIPAYFVDTILALNNGILKKTPVKLICIGIEKREQCERIKHAFDQPFVEYVEQDVGKKFSLPKNIDFIIHAASKASPKFYLADPIGTIDANVNGTRQLLDYCVENKVESFLFFSSGEIYGNPENENVPTKENYLGKSDWLAKRSCYTESKRFSETLCINFYYQFNIPVKIVRPVHVYGPGLRLNDGRVMADFFKDALLGNDINILSDGLASRAFCYISDATTAFWKVLLEGQSGQAYNVGNDKEDTSIKDLAFIISNLFDNKSTVKVLKSENTYHISESPSRSCPCIDKLRRDFNYELQVPLEDGILRLKRWYLQNDIC